jgi:hypothetical protein
VVQVIIATQALDDITATVEQAERAYDKVLDSDHIVVVGDRSSCD